MIWLFSGITEIRCEGSLPGWDCVSWFAKVAAGDVVLVSPTSPAAPQPLLGSLLASLEACKKRALEAASDASVSSGDEDDKDSD